MKTIKETRDPNAMTLTDRARALAERTEDAWSWGRYRSWAACARLLLARGYSDREAEAILRSKWTRWAADRAERDDGATSVHLMNLLDLRGPRTMFKDDADFRRQLAELVAETFA